MTVMQQGEGTIFEINENAARQLLFRMMKAWRLGVESADTYASDHEVRVAEKIPGYGQRRVLHIFEAVPRPLSG
jgi:hypothetical protein